MSLEAELAAAIRAAGPAAREFPFDAWALRVFVHQYEHNRPYRSFCDRRGLTPRTVGRWQEVPRFRPTHLFHAVKFMGPPIRGR